MTRNEVPFGPVAPEDAEEYRAALTVAIGNAEVKGLGYSKALLQRLYDTLYAEDGEKPEKGKKA